MFILWLLLGLMSHNKWSIYTTHYNEKNAWYMFYIIIVI